jgi:hypothetical protein
VNSAAQAASDNGGMAPVTGCHSVIESPERVSRVTPPITTIAKIIAQQHSSQTATGRMFGAAAASVCAAEFAMALGRDTPCKCQQMQGETRSLSAAA